MGSAITLTPEQMSEQAYTNLAHKASQYLDEKSISLLRKAYQFADAQHKEQLRKSGEPYIVHPLAVAELLSDYRLDETSLVVAILHDVVEDTHVSVQQVEELFGKDVASLVDGLTKLAKVEFRSSQEKLAENFRKMVLAMSKDIRVIIIKLADRTHNMRTLKALAGEKRNRIAEETMEIYAPLAGRLGMYKIKAELEDLCLKELKPSVYTSLTERVAQKKDERLKVIENLKQQLTSHLAKEGIVSQVSGRAKHFFSIYKKMTTRKMDFDDIYDLFAVRVVVDTVGQCYEALGVVHTLYRPVPGRFKDYIAMPKANLYQSLHTTIVAARGELVEIQIRTNKMHNIAENGIAAHWAYKEQKKQKDSSLPNELEKFNWLKNIVKHQSELSDPNEFLEAVKVDLFEDEVFVFTPKGDVFELRRGATCLDFAFAIHSDLGLRTAGAKINGRMSTLRTALHSGDVVEILAGPKERASKDWLNIVTTNKAKNKIRTFLRAEEREEAKKSGLELLENAFSRMSTSLEKIQKAGVLQDVNRMFSVGQFDDLVLQIGYGKLDAVQVATKLATASGANFDSPAQSQEELPKLPEIKRSSPSSSQSQSKDRVRVEGLDGLIVRFARCCEPLPGQSIVGFVSRGRGVTIHSSSCQWALTIDPARRVSCSWNENSQKDHNVRLKITSHDRKGLLANITKLISGMGINIAGADVQTTPDGRGIITIKMCVENVSQLKDVHQKLEALEGVMFVERVTG